MNGGSSIVVERKIAASAATVYSYLTESDAWAKWQGVTASIEPTAGGLFRMVMGNGMVALGRFVELQENQRVVFTWGWVDHPGVPPGSSTVEIELVTDGSDTIVRLTHSGLPEDERPMHVMGWDHYLLRLVSVSEGADPGPDPGPGG